MKVFLIGLMGSGKSYWATQLAKKLKTGGYDLDSLIENLEDKTVAELFDEDGEEYFRKTEAKLLRWFGEKKSFVLATGGGTPCFNDNMAWMNKQGITIWLDESIDVLVERLLPEKAHRPLIRDLSDAGLKDFLIAKRTERAAFYGQAIHHLTGKDISLKALQQIIQSHA
ncbi:MAG: shikimate kinase [Chitinophagaceae bacterium]